MSNVGFILFGFPQEIYMAKYKRKKYDRKPLVTNTMNLSLLSKFEMQIITPIPKRIKKVSSKISFAK